MIEKKSFGKTSNGAEVLLYTLKNSKGAYVELISYGCAIRSICVPDRDGKLVDVCLGYDSIEEYESQNGCLGAVIGRHANRIGNAEFTLNGKTYKLAANNGPNNLHGGPNGFNKRVFDSKIVGDSVVFKRVSDDMEEGFPGRLEVSVTYSFSDDNELKIHYLGKSDADTVVNMTNHSYFNLDGHDAGLIYDTLLKINADRFTENDSNCLPTGKILEVFGTPFDFTTEKPIGQDIEKDDQNLKNGSGYDHNFIINGEGLKTAAVAYSEKTGIEMTTLTTKPGVQLYTANFLTNRPAKGKKKNYAERFGFCLETQFFPNAMAIKHFPSPILRAGDVYDQTTVFKFSVR